MDGDVITQRQETVERQLLDPDRKDDWFTKLARVERAKALRRETQKARKGKSFTASEAGRWSHGGQSNAY